MCRQYPNCDAPIPSEIGNNICNDAFNIEDCGFDGGDVVYCVFGIYNLIVVDLTDCNLLVVLPFWKCKR